MVKLAGITDEFDGWFSLGRFNLIELTGDDIVKQYNKTLEELRKQDSKTIAEAVEKLQAILNFKLLWTKIKS